MSIKHPDLVSLASWYHLLWYNLSSDITFFEGGVNQPDALIPPDLKWGLKASCLAYKNLSHSKAYIY